MCVGIESALNLNQLLVCMIYKCRVKKDDTCEDGYCIEIPDEFIQKLGLNEGSILKMFIQGNQIFLKKSFDK